MSSDGTISQEWLSQALVNESPEAIVVSDAKGTIQLWNSGATKMFGFSAEDAIGQNLELIIPEKLRKRHWDGYDHTMSTGYTKYGDKLLAVPATHQDGHRLSIEFSVALLRNENDEIVGISAIMREVSERREAEQAMRAQLAELKRQVDATAD